MEYDDDDDFYDTVQDVRNRKSVAGTSTSVLPEKEERNDEEREDREYEDMAAAAAAASAERERAAYLFEEYQEKIAALNAESERLRRFQWLQEQKELQKEKEQMRMQQRKQQPLSPKASLAVQNVERRSLSHGTATARTRKEITSVETSPTSSKVTSTNIFQCGVDDNIHGIDEDGYEVEIDTSDVDSYQALVYELQEERMIELQKERDLAEKKFRQHQQNHNQILKETQRRRKDREAAEAAAAAAAASIQPSLSSYSLWSF